MRCGGRSEMIRKRSFSWPRSRLGARVDVHARLSGPNTNSSARRIEELIAGFWKTAHGGIEGPRRTGTSSTGCSHLPAGGARRCNGRGSFSRAVWSTLPSFSPFPTSRSHGQGERPADSDSRARG
jgi:hypothetical protein